MKALLVTEAGVMGLGHVVRSVALKRALESLGWQVKLLLNREGALYVREKGMAAKEQILERMAYDGEALRSAAAEAPDLTIIDSYLAGADFISGLRQATGAPVAEFDDYMRYERPYRGDIVINGNLYAEAFTAAYASYFTYALLGVRYLPMRTPLRHPAEPSSGGEGILITCGGSDLQNTTLQVVQSLRNWKGKISAVVGPFFTQEQILSLSQSAPDVSLIIRPDTLDEAIASHAVIVTAAGTTVYEVLHAKRRLVPIQTADNQRYVYQALMERGFLGLDSAQLSVPDYVKRVITAVQENTAWEADALYTEVDGRGAFRLAEALTSITDKMRGE